MHLSLPARRGVLLWLGAATLASVGVTTPAEAAPGWCTPTGVLDVTKMPAEVPPTTCLLVGRILGDGVTQVQVPVSGGQGAFSTPSSGEVTDLVVFTRPDGTVEINPVQSDASLNPVTDPDLYVPPSGGVSDDNLNGAAPDAPDASLTAGTAPGSPNKCSDTARAYYSGYPRWAATPTWYFNASGKPSAYSTSTFTTATRDAQVNITRGDNSCGWSADPKIYANNGGATTYGQQITSSTTSDSCGTQDSRSVVGWGPLPGTVLGLTCMRWDSNYHFVGGDMRLANNKSWSVGSLSGCVGKWDYEGLVTHEFGHWFGLTHVSESTHGNLVMSTDVNGTCQANERNLGNGDLSGLIGLYGKS